MTKATYNAKGRYLKQVLHLKIGCKYFSGDDFAEAMQDVLGLELRQELIEQAHRDIAERSNKWVKD